jgi:TonB-dependent SusC/RagA subfamily outer membrane receptor
MGRRELSVRDAANFTNLEELVNGRYAGLEVRRVAGGALSLRVRDSRSTLVDAEPLLVLDGVAIGAEGASDMLASISPREVKRVELLKDAAATAYYGSRGANGVVIITTRRLD